MAAWTTYGPNRDSMSKATPAWSRTLCRDPLHELYDERRRRGFLGGRWRLDLTRDLDFGADEWREDTVDAMEPIDLARHADGRRAVDPRSRARRHTLDRLGVRQLE